MHILKVASFKYVVAAVLKMKRNTGVTSTLPHNQKLITSLSISLHKKIHSLSYYPRAKVLCFYTYYLQTLNKKPSKLSVLTF